MPTSPSPQPTAATAAEEATLTGLHDRLVAAARDAGLVDLGYRTVATPLGDLLLVASDRGLLRVAFAGEDHSRVLTGLARTLSPRILSAPSLLAEPARQIEEYFDGGRRSFELRLDLRLAAGFRRNVLDHLLHLGYGHTESYSQVAAAVGRPAAVRAVGSACATNPLPVVVPCHRVVRSDGSIGEYLGGPEAKRTLLALEASGTSRKRTAFNEQTAG